MSLTNDALDAIEKAAKDLLNAIDLDDSIGGWPDHFDEAFHEAAGPKEVLELVACYRRLLKYECPHGYGPEDACAPCDDAAEANYWKARR